jgi:hypothetical protein
VISKNWLIKHIKLHNEADSVTKRKKQPRIMRPMQKSPGVLDFTPGLFCIRLMYYAKSDDRLSGTLKQNWQYEKYYLWYKKTVLLTPVLNIWGQSKDKFLIGLLVHNMTCCLIMNSFARTWESRPSQPHNAYPKSFIKSTHIFRFGVIDADADHETRNFFDIHIRLDDLGLMNHYGET